MTRGQLLRELIRSGVAQDQADFERLAIRLIDAEREKKHHLLANDLERILHGEKASNGTQSPPTDLPRDKDSGLPLVEVVSPVRDFGDIVLSPDVMAVLEQVLLEQSRRDVLASYGLKPVQRLLFYGPPGCGKTVAAEALASELSLHLVRVRFDGVVSSFLGETAANLGAVFEFITSGHYVVIFDEFDAIAKDRDDATEHGELKRVVNALLMMMDSYQGASILIAATNHEGLLDAAIWRRFDEVALLDVPNASEVSKLIRMKLRGVQSDLPLHDPRFIHKFAALSHADIERILHRAVKAMIFAGDHSVGLQHIEESLTREWARLHRS